MQYQLALPAPKTSSASYETSTDENDHRYVGLVNQAMTCYLNSLLQTLYMTPEFRNAIYSWINTAKLSDEPKNIPMQLKKLFLLLQTSDKPSLETRDLTHSFGWESHDSYEQHDVQELCRVMFDALEHRFRKSDAEHANLIDKLYKGTLEDYVKCLTCQNEKVRTDSFYDLPLAIKPFGFIEAFKCIEDALRDFTKPEILDGRNKYSCDRCHSDQDAEKGLRIITFPYILSLQLKRFDFDYRTMFRVKLNDRMTFPDYLDVNDFIHQPNKPRELARMSYADAIKSKPSAASEDDDSIKNDDVSSFKWMNVPRDSDSVQELLNRSPYVYELFSIMVHQGNASGGHYFAYIKNMEQGKWMCFNDTSVQPASDVEIYRTFGGYIGGWTANANAYMLMYRQIDVKRNQNFIRTDSLPANVQELREKMVLQEEEQRLRAEEERKFTEESALLLFEDEVAQMNEENQYYFMFWDQEEDDALLTLRSLEDSATKSGEEEYFWQGPPADSSLMDEQPESSELQIGDDAMYVDEEKETVLGIKTVDGLCFDRLSPITADHVGEQLVEDIGKETCSHARHTVCPASGSSRQSSSLAAAGRSTHNDRTNDVAIEDDEGVGLDETTDAGSDSALVDDNYTDKRKRPAVYDVCETREPMISPDVDDSEFPEGPVEASIVPDLSTIRSAGRRSPSSRRNSLTPPSTPDFMRVGEEALGMASPMQERDDSVNVSGFNSPADRSPVISESGGDDDGSALDTAATASKPPLLVLPDEEEKMATAADQAAIPLPATAPLWTRRERPLRIQKASFSETD